MTVEFTARFDDSLSDFIKEVVAEVALDDYVKSDDISDKISDHFSGYADPTDYFDMSNYVTEDDALTDLAVEELIDTALYEHKATTEKLQATLQAILDALVNHGFVPTGWEAPKEGA